MLFKPAVALLLASSAAAQAADTSARDSILAQNVMSAVNITSIEDSIKKKVTAEVFKKTLEDQIKAEVQAKVDEIVAE